MERTAMDSWRDFRRGQEWFDGLIDNQQRDELGNCLVLGDFDWREWGFERRPTRAFMNGVDDARLNWEMRNG